MGFDVAVVLMCAGLWLLHGVRLARVPWRRAWPAHLIVLLGGGTTAAAFWWLRPAAPYVAIGAVVGLLIVPALAVRGASRALRFGRFGMAKALAQVAAVLRPLPTQRRFIRAVELTRQLSRGEALDLDRALSELGAVDPVERAVHRVAFMSWTNDFEAMAEGLESPRVRSHALRAGMGAIVTTVVGETGTAAELVMLYGQLRERRALSRRSLDAAGTLVATAAYLGDVETVRGFADELTSELPAERVAFTIATAEQRAGDREAAERTIARALEPAATSVSGRQRLEYRRRHPLAPIGKNELHHAQATLRDVRARLDARRALAPLGLGFSRPAPLTWTLTAVLAAVFVWQSTQPRRVVFDAWGLVAPFDLAPDAFRLLSYAMLHVDTGHLLVNLLGLVIFGRFVETSYRRWRFVVIYVLGALAGSGAFLWFSTRLGTAIGASGAVLALFGATIARIALDARLRKTAQGRRELVFLGAIAVAQLIGDQLLAESSGSAHAGGFLAGFALGAVLVPRPTRGPSR